MIDLGNIIRYLVHYGNKYSDKDIYKYIYQITHRFEVTEELEFFINEVLSSKKTFNKFCKDEKISIFNKEEEAREYLELLRQMLDYGNDNSLNSVRTFLKKEDFNDAIFFIREIERLQECDTKIRLQGYKQLETIYKTLKDFELYAHIIYGEKTNEFENIFEEDEFNEKFENIFDTIKLWEQEVEPFMRIYGNTNEDEGETDVRGNGKTYTDNLIKLFHNNTDLIDKLIGKSDEEIAACIKKWCNERDKLGKPLINNPKNNLRKDFAEALKENGIISGAVTTFRKKL